MKHTPIVFRVDQGAYSPVFSLRQPAVSDDSGRLQRLIDNSDADDKSMAGYKANVALLADLASPWPDSVKDKEGKKMKRPDEALDSAESVNAFFADADVDKDWLGEFAVRAIYSRCQPTVSFF